MNDSNKYHLIGEWKKLLDKGIITEEEFEYEKKLLLNPPNSIVHKPLENNSNGNSASTIKDWYDLLNAGIINQEEFDVEKAKLLQSSVVEKMQAANASTLQLKDGNVPNHVEDVAGIAEVEQEKGLKLKGTLIVLGIAILAIFLVIVYTSKKSSDMDSVAADSTASLPTQSNSHSNTEAADSSAPPAITSPDSQSGTSTDAIWNSFFQSFSSALENKNIEALIAMTEKNFSAGGDMQLAKDWWTRVFSNQDEDYNYAKLKKLVAQGVTEVKFPNSTSPAKVTGQGEAGDLIFENKNGEWKLASLMGD